MDPSPKTNCKETTEEAYTKGQNHKTTNNIMDNTQKAIDEARDIMESFDPCPATTVGFDKESYVLTSEQMLKIATALYLADCKIQDNNKGGRQ